LASASAIRLEKPMPPLVRELRRKAALCRRAASISTSGSGKPDRILLALAEQLERETALRERQLQDRSLLRARSGYEETSERSQRGGPSADDPSRGGGWRRALVRCAKNRAATRRGGYGCR